MTHRQGPGREEPIRLNLEETIEANNPIRVIDVYVDSLDLSELGFPHVVPADTGTPPYHPGDLLKLYIYGYENRLRSSRQLARACQVNIELWWLLKGVVAFLPDDRAFSVRSPRCDAPAVRPLRSGPEGMGLAGSRYPGRGLGQALCRRRRLLCLSARLSTSNQRPVLHKGAGGLPGQTLQDESL